MRSAAQIGKALRLLRQTANVSQEDFGVVSSRTYVSSIERGLKSPTLGKIEQLAEVLGIHPLTVLTVAYMEKCTQQEVEKTVAALREELLTIVSSVQK